LKDDDDDDDGVEDHGVGKRGPFRWMGVALLSGVSGSQFIIRVIK